MIGYDYTDRIDPAALKAAECEVVFRYVMPQTPFWVKALRNAEAIELRAAQIPIVSNFESTANRMASGASAGRDDAVQLLANWKALNAPAGLIGWFSADWNVQPSDVPAVLAYLNAAAGVLGGKRYVGCYGGLRAVAAAADAGFGIWQTIAWSGGVWDPRAVARQTGEQPVVGGVRVDTNEIINLAALGAWGGPTTGEPEMTPQEKEDLVNEIVTKVAAAVYHYGEEDVTVNGQVIHNTPFGHEAHGAWFSTNDPDGPVLAALADLKQAVVATKHELDTVTTALGKTVTP